ncbi:MAG: GYD domain-containing protein [Armatimonadetes bacterium]|nr:GYD domain-containing protein [Armatimonadota bacterium]
MPYYLVQAVYTPEAWGAMVRKPQNRADIVRPVIESMGGKLEAAFLAFGEHDAVLIIQMPDNVSAAALSMAVSAGRGVKSIKTTPLMTKAEAVKAMRKAGGLKYSAPA